MEATLLIATTATTRRKVSNAMMGLRDTPASFKFGDEFKVFAHTIKKVFENIAIILIDEIIIILNAVVLVLICSRRHRNDNRAQSLFELDITLVKIHVSTM